MTSPLDPAWTPTADLRAENERLQIHVESMIGAMKAENERLKELCADLDARSATYEREVERLRAALKEILSYDPSFSWEIARAALADQGKG